eukprot:TRINITY_DN10944_c0_g1_i1.p1 TRINITY_DN10944_c0_g1~~TRINITY_DN10944_c0_g1_i1.p1  ORF type:complete len:784 (-),score=159.86 TRINITY_DN10944_c0_g1_i1:150-2258(-)
MSLLPIGGNSLVYGTCDAADTVVNSDLEVSHRMLAAAELLNIKEHDVCEHSRVNTVRLAAAADLEVHKGCDGRFYLLDYSRGMPPQDVALQRKVPMRHMLLKLRPEWLNVQPKPLNPDVFSYFIKLTPPEEPVSAKEAELRERLAHQRKQDEIEVKEATRKLLEEQIPFVARRLPELTLPLNGWEAAFIFRAWTVVLTHFYGVNLRFMGIIRNEMEKLKEEYKTVESSHQAKTNSIQGDKKEGFKLPTSFNAPNFRWNTFLRNLWTEIDVDGDGMVKWEEFVSFLLRLSGRDLPDPNFLKHLENWSNHFLIQMIARVLKHEFNRKLREEMMTLKQTGERPYILVVVKYLNLIFGESDASTKFWKKPLRKLLRKQFLDCLLSIPSETNLKEMLKGIKLDLVDDSDSTGEISGLCYLFVRLCDLCGFEWRGSTKQQFTYLPHLYNTQQPFDMNDLVALDERIKKTQIIAHSQGVVLRMKAGVTSGREKYSRNLSWESVKEFIHSLSAVPRNQRTLRNTADVFLENKFFGMADLLYKLAEESVPNDPVTLYKYAYFMEQRGRLEEAEIYYKKSIELKPRAGSLIIFAKFLVAQEKYAKARETFKRAIELFPKNAVAHRNYSRFLFGVLGEKGEEVEYSLKRAVEIEPKSPEIHMDLSQYYAASGNTEKEKYHREMSIKLLSSTTGTAFSTARTKPLAMSMPARKQ